MKNIKEWISDYRVILLLFIAISVTAGIQSLLLSPKSLYEGGREYNRYNNYTIFKQSFYHLIDQKDLYVLYPDEHWDLYKYSPTFSLFFGLFAILPDGIGVVLWDMLNALILVFAIYYLPKLTPFQKGLILLASAIETMTALQNEQSNGLMAGLIILAFGLCERRHFFLAAFCLTLSVYIKIFGIVGFALFIFYPGKWKLIYYTLTWTLILLVLPLIVVNLHQLNFLYESWYNMLINDHTPSAYGFSVFGWIKTWFQMQVSNLAILLIGVVIFLLPFSRIKMYSSFDFRLIALSSILVWIVIFNHMAESPTFVIAMAGVTIWFFSGKPTLINVILFSSALILTSLSTTDLFPAEFRKDIIQPYVLKAFPCILIWIKIIVDMFTIQGDDTTPIKANFAQNLKS